MENKIEKEIGSLVKIIVDITLIEYIIFNKNNEQIKEYISKKIFKKDIELLSKNGIIFLSIVDKTIKTIDEAEKCKEN